VPITDDYGQGIQIAALTDAPDAAKLAKDIGNALAPRSIMRFASASTRAATLIGAAAPAEGMQTWLIDVNRMEIFDGSAWVTAAVGTSAWTTIGLVSPWTHNGNSNGNLQYRVVSFFGENTIMFRGAIARTSYPGSVPGSFTINSTNLPVSARPTTQRTVNIPCSDIASERISLKLDINTDGSLIIYGTGSTVKPPWIGFNGTFCSL